MNKTIKIVLSIIFFSILIYAFSGGPPAGHTGAPGESNCTSCHSSFPVNSGPGALEIIAPSNYVPGNTYLITVQLQQTGQTRWGFQVTALTSGNQPAGILTVTDPINTQKVVTTRQYIHHTSNGTYNGTSNGPVQWQFNWQAPATNVGNVIFYVAGNAANGNGSTSGDYIYTKSIIVPVILGSISGIVYHDQNANGIKDLTEPGLQNWQIKLSGAKIDSTFTDQNGLYSFSNLLDGLYEVNQIVQYSWIQTEPIPPSYSLNISGATNYTDINFGNAQLGKISGKKFHDKNQNGVMDENETGISNWKIYYFRSSPSEEKDSVYTDIDGNYTFANLLSGEYIISEELKDRWIQTYPPNPNTYTVNLELNQHITDINFGNKSLDTTIQVSVRSGWNILSVPLIVEDFRKNSVYPQSTSSAFMYSAGIGYNTRDTLYNGIGYWLKFNNNAELELIGIEINEDTINVFSGWNLIGTISHPIPVQSITAYPPTMTTSNFYGYISGYIVVDTLKPGFGYWVKVDQDGYLILKK